METNIGVPLGIVLGPLVSPLYTIDFREKVRENFKKFQFPVDTSFHFSRNNAAELEKFVSQTLGKTDNYLKQNKLSMNTG